MARLHIFLCFLFQATYGLINPILPGWNPDPSILRVDKDYFIATSTFETFPGHPIWHSTNLSDWSLLGYALNRPSQLSLLGTPSAGGLWAPTLRHNKGRFYLSTTSRHVYTPELRQNSRSFYVWTDDIFSNTWSDPVYYDSVGYDADIFFDSSGDVYNTWAGINNPVDQMYGIWQTKIDLESGDPLTPAELIFNGTLPLNSSARPEGPHVYLINETYYLLIAEGGTQEHHRASIQRGPSPSGPWENNPNNPIVFNGFDLSLPVQSTGHADMVEGTDGQWWGTCLGTRPQGLNFSHQQLGRETFLSPVTWKNGWPFFNNGEPISEHVEGVLADNPHVATFEDDFEQSENDTLGPSYTFQRTPVKKFYSLAARPGYLRLKGNSFDLGDRDNPAFVIRKQGGYNETFETQLEFDPTSNLTEAGIAAFANDWNHAAIGVTVVNGTKSIVTRYSQNATQVGPWALTLANNTLTTVTYSALQTSEPIKLTIVGEPTSYKLGYVEGNSTEFTWTAEIDSILLTIPMPGGVYFTGTNFGVYNTGHGRPTIVPADFAYWKQVPGSTSVETEAADPFGPILEATTTEWVRQMVN